VARAAKSNNIILLALPSHTSHLYQPLDVGVFHSLKNEFGILGDQLKIEQAFQTRKRIDFVNILYQSHQLAMKSTNLIHGFEGACIYPCNKEKALEKCKSLNKETLKKNSEKKSPSKYSNILVVPQDQRIQNTKIKYNGIISSQEFIDNAEKKLQEKDNKEKEKKEKKQIREQKKKDKEEKRSTEVVIKKQKKDKVFCNCRKACSTNKKCVCKTEGKFCTEYCSCHNKCQNNDNAKTPQIPSVERLCCVSKCTQTSSPADVVCSECKKWCHSNTCTMPLIKQKQGTNVSTTVCNDCGEKEH
jgi:hypothetical protein